MVCQTIWLDDRKQHDKRLIINGRGVTGQLVEVELNEFQSCALSDVISATCCRTSQLLPCRAELIFFLASREGFYLQLHNMFSRYDQAVDALYRRINFESLTAGKPGGYSSGDFKLERMKRLLAAMGNPHEKIPAVHVAGTKGKGTTCSLVAQILQRAGYRVGLFTSPHMYRLEERFQVNSAMPSPARLTKMVNQLIPVVEELDRNDAGLCTTFFEIVNAIAWLYFLEEQVDIVVLEVGLGGRLDSTIFCNPIVTAITSISLDHTRILGNSVEEIAREKAGILKTRIPLVCGVTEPAAQKTILKTARDLECPVQQLDRDFKFSIEKPWELRERIQRVQYIAESGQSTFSLKQPGIAVAQNATLAVAIIQQLRKQSYHISDEAVQQGMINSPLPLRFEILSDRPILIVDSAHNEASVASVMKTTFQHFPDISPTIILSVSRDKDYQAICNQLQGIDLIIVTRYLGNRRALPVAELSKAVENSCKAKTVSATSPEHALQLAREQTDSDGIILATGSLFLAAEIRELVLKENQPAE